VVIKPAFPVAVIFSLLSALSAPRAAEKTILLKWGDCTPSGKMGLSQEGTARLKIVRGKGRVDRDTFSFETRQNGELAVEIQQPRLDAGAGATLVHVRTQRKPFSFFLRDVHKDTPMIIPAYSVAVTEAGDKRSYEEIAAAVIGKGHRTTLQRIEDEPEETFANAAARTRDMYVPTWLGLSRDIRIFEMRLGEPYTRNDVIVPKLSGSSVRIPELGNSPLRYRFTIGRGRGCVENIRRRLDDGSLPILRGCVSEEDVQYHFTTFVSLEATPLRPDTLRGTSYLVADGYAAGHMFTPQQQKQYNAIRATEVDREEETVLYFQAKAVNAGAVPRYAWFKAPEIFPEPSIKAEHDSVTGFTMLSADRVSSMSRLNGNPAPQQEIAVLIQPGQSAAYEFMVPHRPISRQRALALAQQDFSQRHEECRAFWRSKLATAAEIKLPEKRIEEMIRAGLLHLDMICFGLEPEGTLAPMIGVYAPIGSESSPIIQFMDSLGWHNKAERTLQFFLDKQHDDGMIQNFGGYMLETGAALWSMGEHYRMTRDETWAKRIRPNVIKACDFLIQWRERNKREDLRSRGWGMIDGKVADPPDHYRVYMLNGYAYLGLKRAAEMLADVDPDSGSRIRAEADGLREDIRAALFESMARSPIVPLGDGSWCPTVPPWAEATGPSMLFVEDDPCYTHGTFTARDSMLGPLYLMLQEVISPEEDAAKFMLNYNADLMLQRNVGYSQPYYCRHDWLQLKLNLVKPFLKTYYNTLSSLADRETYTFYEHYFYSSPHKTHEEAWFLMQTRWMLWMEEGNTLKLLPGIPRAWLKDGQTIEIKNAASYFGSFSLTVASHLDDGWLEAEVQCDSDRKPPSVSIRLPHPEGRLPASVKGGFYDGKNEAVRIEPFSGRAKIKVRY